MDKWTFTFGVPIMCQQKCIAKIIKFAAIHIFSVSYFHVFQTAIIGLDLESNATTPLSADWFQPKKRKQRFSS